jgi:catechol 2,3-dioxygenase-like lactoylglutathione lyase family enzyme
MGLSNCKVGPAAAVADIERAARFYEEVLGLEADPDQQIDESMRVYPCADGTGIFVYVSEFAGTNKATLAGFEADDFDAIHAELAERGVQFESYEDEASGMATDENGVLDGGFMKVAWFKDPDGNIYSINSAPS